MYALRAYIVSMIPSPLQILKSIKMLIKKYKNSIKNQIIIGTIKLYNNTISWGLWQKLMHRYDEILLLWQVYFNWSKDMNEQIWIISCTLTNVALSLLNANLHLILYNREVGDLHFSVSPYWNWLTTNEGEREREVGNQKQGIAIVLIPCGFFNVRRHQF